jgi:hypothetical protein
MTLIIALGNRDQVIQISDRRVTVNGILQDDESNKAGVLFCANARLAFGFTGLARFAEFETRHWLLNALIQSAPPDFNAHKMLERLKEHATQDFQNLPPLRQLPNLHKQLTVMFSGYLLHHTPPLAANAILTNYQYSNLPPINLNKFECFYWNERRPLSEEFTFIQVVGFSLAVNNQDIDSLRTLLRERRPSKAIINKAVEVMYSIADRPQSQGTIGKQLSTIMVPKDPYTMVNSSYYTSYSTHKVYIPDMVFAQSAKSIAAVANATVEAVEPSDTPPLAVPKIGRNQPCPCGSGKKYKKCHGLKK